jgi:hypothetical protein
VADTGSAVTGLGALVGSLSTIIGAIAYFAGLLVNRHRRKHGYDPKRGDMDEPITRRLPTVPDSPPVDATVDTLRALVSRLQRDNEALRDSLREATRANDVEATALRRQLATEKRERAEAEGKLAAQFYDVRRLQAQVEVLAAEVNQRRVDESAGLSTPRSDPPGVPTLRPGRR